MVDFTKQTPFPWLMSNVIDNETKRPLAEGLTSHVIEWGGKKVRFYIICSDGFFVINSCRSILDRSDWFGGVRVARDVGHH